MSDKQLQCKYLDAGAKSSLVVLDPNLSTGNNKTIYLYHQQRNQIIEYNREIVGAKLRDLNAAEAKGEGELLKGYEKARNAFSPRASALDIPERSQPSRPPAARSSSDSDEEGEDIGFVDENELYDDDEEEEAEESED